MTEKRFRTGKGIVCGDYFSETIIDTETNEKYYGGIKPNYISSKQIVELLNQLCEENQQLKKENHNRRALLVDELRGLFQMYLTQCRSISEEAIITLIRNDVKKRVFEVFDE